MRAFLHANPVRQCITAPQQTAGCLRRATVPARPSVRQPRFETIPNSTPGRVTLCVRRGSATARHSAAPSCIARTIAWARGSRLRSSGPRNARIRAHRYAIGVAPSGSLAKVGQLLLRRVLISAPSPAQLVGAVRADGLRGCLQPSLSSRIRHATGFRSERSELAPEPQRFGAGSWNAALRTDHHDQRQPPPQAAVLAKLTPQLSEWSDGASTIVPRRNAPMNHDAVPFAVLRRSRGAGHDLAQDLARCRV